ncbi:MAG: cation-transporting P-type ATPase, partial [Bacilli bacterium]|nr:cation-transporting P-type ATPase [Bacilli bacterium]
MITDELGLTEIEVVKMRQKYGSNVISEKKQSNFWQLFLENLGDPIIRILLIALAIKTLFLIRSFDWYETIGIVIAILMASV